MSEQVVSPEPTVFDEVFVFFTLFSTALVIFCICRTGFKQGNNGVQEESGGKQIPSQKKKGMFTQLSTTEE